MTSAPAPRPAEASSALPGGEGAGAVVRYALVGNPNTGKTTLFNQLCGTRSHTANFPGSTCEARIGTVSRDERRLEIVDLPGHYGLNLKRPESSFCRAYLQGDVATAEPPDAILVIADASNLSRNLIFVSQALQQGLPAVLALNMIDVARRRGLEIDVIGLAERLGCPVVPVCARHGGCVSALLATMSAPTTSEASLPDPTDAVAAAAWADQVVAECVTGARPTATADDRLSDRLDRVFTHPLWGLLVFTAVMTGLFCSIFMLATVPMDLIEVLFARLGVLVSAALPPGAIRSVLADGVVPGIAGAVVFLPQICLLFFLISLLEDTGYLARAAFLMDRLLRRFGLPGQAFVPLLSAHACAIPAIMSARLVPDIRDRLATILVAPLMSCSARLPVYVLLIGILFADRPVLAGLAFSGCYVLGAVAALLTAWVARRTVLRGPTIPMVLELPAYRLPSLRSAVVTTWDRASTFLKNAGTMIVAICVVLWWLGEYPHVAPPAESIELRAQAEGLGAEDAGAAEALLAQADRLEAKDAKARSFVGRLGHVVEPVLEPIGCDWQLSIGLLSSFVAREVFVSTMAVVLTGNEADLGEDEGIRQRIVRASRADGTPLFTTATAASLLVFYVFAMQCLPTLAVTRRETGSWRWPLLQLTYMSVLAYVLALAVHQGLLMVGVA